MSVHAWAGLTVTKTLAAAAMELSHAGKWPPSPLWPMVARGDLGLWRRAGGPSCRSSGSQQASKSEPMVNAHPGMPGAAAAKIFILSCLFVRRRLLMEPSDSLIG